MKKYYAVKNGRIPGIYESWEDCQKEVNGFSGAIFKSFQTFDEAKAFVLGEEPNIVKNQSELHAISYVDGSFSLEKAMFSFGAVIFYNGEELQFKKAFSDPELVSMRNVAGEIKGAEFVMNYCYENNIKSVEIHYDYEGIEKWCTGVWKATKKGTHDYVEFYKKISEKVEVKFVKVKGHSGDKYNDLVDTLAKGALGIE